MAHYWEKGQSGVTLEERVVLVEETLLLRGLVVLYLRPKH
jgi:hypothetical protein